MNWTILKRTAPTDETELRDYVRVFMGVKVPGHAVCPGHDSPATYLADMFFERVGDCVVWAPRGGGKTMLAATLTLLESLFRPGCATRILGGSSRQSRYLYEHFRAFLSGQFTADVKESRRDHTRLVNGSAVEIMTQSERTVRGAHVPRLRLDEVEEFRREVFDAALFIPQSRPGLRARTEMLSTVHRPYGLMSELIDQATEKGLRVYKWCLLEVLQRCVDRSCSRCVLWQDCAGRARETEGYYSIDDAVAKKRLVSSESWQAEMLCRRPSREGLFYRGWDEDLHVTGEPLRYRADWELYRAFDWGVNGPTVCLWVQVDGDGRVYVVDELYQSGKAISDMAVKVVTYERERGFGKAQRSYCDPSGSAFVAEFSKAGVVASGRREDGGRVNVRQEGFEIIRRLLKTDENGRAKLVVSPMCVNTRREFRTYRYPAVKAGTTPTEEPAKVNDHAMDALRYFATGRFGGRGWQFR